MGMLAPRTTGAVRDVPGRPALPEHTLVTDDRLGRDHRRGGGGRPGRRRPGAARASSSRRAPPRASRGAGAVTCGGEPAHAGAGARAGPGGGGRRHRDRRRRRRRQDDADGRGGVAGRRAGRDPARPDPGRRLQPRRGGPPLGAAPGAVRGPRRRPRAGAAGPRPLGGVDRHVPLARRADRPREPLRGRASTPSSASSRRSRRRRSPTRRSTRRWPTAWDCRSSWSWSAPPARSSGLRDGHAPGVRPAPCRGARTPELIVPDAPGPDAAMRRRPRGGDGRGRRTRRRARTTTTALEQMREMLLAGEAGASAPKLRPELLAGPEAALRTGELPGEARLAGVGRSGGPGPAGGVRRTTSPASGTATPR